MIWSRIRGLFGAPATASSTDIVQAYGAVLGRTGMAMDGSRLLDELPFDKAAIKAAIIDAAKMDGVSPEQLNALGIAYTELASFQRGGGGENPLRDVRIDPSSMTSQDVDELARKIVGSRGNLELGEIILAEQRTLLGEWSDLLKEMEASHA